MSTALVTRVLKIRGQADTTCTLSPKDANDNAKALCTCLSPQPLLGRATGCSRERRSAHAPKCARARVADDRSRAAAINAGKFIYARMFDWLVERVNKSMTDDGSGNRSKFKNLLYVGILDIFG